MKSTFPLLIIEDHYILRTGLKHIIHNLGFNQDIHVLDSESILEIERFLAKGSFKIIIVDSAIFANQSKIFLPVIEDNGSKTSLLILYENPDHVDFSTTVAFENIGYISKNSNPKEFGLAIDSLIKGEACYSVQLCEKVEFQLTTDKLKDLNLTKREEEVLKLVLKDKSSREISEILFLSQRTVETHRYNLLKKIKNSLNEHGEIDEKSCLQNIQIESLFLNSFNTVLANA